MRETPFVNPIISANGLISLASPGIAQLPASPRYRSVTIYKIKISRDLTNGFGSFIGNPKHYWRGSNVALLLDILIGQVASH